MLAISAAVGRQPRPGLAEQAIGLAKVFENISADDRIEPAGRQRQVQRLDIANEHLVEPRACRRSGRLVELDADDLGPLAGLERLAQPSRAAADVEDGARRFRNQGEHLGSCVAEVERVLAVVSVAVRVDSVHRRERHHDTRHRLFSLSQQPLHAMAIRVFFQNLFATGRRDPLPQLLAAQSYSILSTRSSASR